MKKHPLQFVTEDKHGTWRFNQNKIVNDLLEFASERGFDLNEIAMRDYDIEDRRQFAQLIGYSVYGYESLSYSESDIWEIVQGIKKEGKSAQQVELEILKDRFSRLKEAMKEPVSEIFDIHIDDLN